MKDLLIAFLLAVSYTVMVAILTTGSTNIINMFVDVTSFGILPYAVLGIGFGTLLYNVCYEPILATH